MLLLTPSVSGLFKWRQFEPEVILLAVGWYLRFSLSAARWKNSLPSADFRSTTSRCGDGYSATPQKFSAVCERGSDRPTTVGGWMRRTSGSKANGYTCTELSIPPVTKWRFTKAKLLREVSVKPILA